MFDNLNDLAITDEKVDESVSYDLTTQEGRLDYIFVELAKAFGDKLSYKGGYMLMKLIRNEARLSEDIDFSILTNDIYEEIKYRLECIAKDFIEKGIAASYEIKPEIAPTMSGGIKINDVNGELICGVDVGWHDTTYGITNYKINNIDIKGFMVERMLADKFTAILTPRRFRRFKDIYDVYIITNVFDVDMGLVYDFMLKRNVDKPIKWENWPFKEDVVAQLEVAYRKLKVRSVVEKDKLLTPPDFNVLMERVDKMYECLIRHYDTRYVWSAVDSTFKGK